MQLKGKTAIVTGSSRGLGKAIAWKLGNMGANIVLNGSPASTSLDATAEEFKAAGINVVVAKGDVKNPEDVENMVKTAMDAFGRIDILVNNAGITRDTLMLKMSEKDWGRCFEYKLKKCLSLYKSCLQNHVKTKSGKL